MVERIRWHRWAMLISGLVLVWVSSAPPCRAEVVDRIAAVVNEEIILQSELEKALDDYRQMARESGFANAPPTPSRAEMLEKMIADKLVDQEAKRLRITISEEEIDRSIERIQQVNKISKEQMLQLFKIKGISQEEYRSQIKEQILQARIVTREVKSKVVITEEDLRNYYRERQGQYGGSTKYHLRHILIQPSSSEPDERERVRRNMQRLRERARKGEAFDQLAKTFSQAATAPEGGDLGEFETRLLTEKIRRALEGLRAGDVTEVVETEQGYQIFYVEDIVRAGGKSFEEVKEEIHEKLLADVTEKRFEEWFKALQQRAHIEKPD